MSTFVNKKEYIKRKLEYNYNNLINDSVEISDNEAEQLRFYNYFVGLSNSDKRVFTESDLTAYKIKPESGWELTVPGVHNGSGEDDPYEYNVWIYPKSWGIPSQMNNSGIDSIGAWRFNDEDVTFEGSTDYNVAINSGGAGTYTIIW